MNDKRLTLDSVKQHAEENDDQVILNAIEQIEKARAQIARLDAQKKKKAGETRGGARDGAGAPTKMGEPATERLAFRITEKQAAALDEHIEDGESRNQAARRLLLERLEE